MTHTEFETIAGYEVEYDTYKKIIEPMYLATELDKTSFVKILNRKAFEKKTTTKPKSIRIKVGDCPNGTIIHIDGEFAGVDITTGKVLVRNPSECRTWACVCYDAKEENVIYVK